MTISQILDDTESSAAEKLSELGSVITKARKAYGNEELEIAIPKVPTTDGYVTMQLLSADDKLVLASTEIRNIIINVTAGTELTEGVVFDRQLEFYLAINPILVNLGATTKSAYL